MLEMIEKARKGDKEAFINLIKLVEKKLYVIARSRLNNEEDIKDAVQETIFLLYKNIAKLKDIQKFNGYMVKIMINSCNKIVIKKGKHISYDVVQNEEILIEKDKYEDIDKKLDFFTIISFLEVEERTLISMYYSDDYTTKEISEILKMNESTIRSKIKRIKEKLKQRYGEEGIE